MSYEYLTAATAMMTTTYGGKCDQLTGGGGVQHNLRASDVTNCSSVFNNNAVFNCPLSPRYYCKY